MRSARLVLNRQTSRPAAGEMRVKFNNGLIYVRSLISCERMHAKSIGGGAENASLSVLMSARGRRPSGN
jgi:hypothetical protein